MQIINHAEGTINIKKNRNNNYIIDLNVMCLESPERLNPPKVCYVVWMNSQGNNAKNMGQIKPSDSLFPNILKSSLKAISTTLPTSFFITSEDDGNIKYPNGQVVLRTQVE